MIPATVRNALATALAGLGCTLAHADLSEGQLAAELAYTALHGLDWAQTRSIAASPRAFEEKNILLGPHPSRSKVNAYFASTLTAHWAIAYVLPANAKPWFQSATIALELGVVAHNYHIGLSARF